MGDWFAGIFAAMGAFFVIGTIWFWIISAAVFAFLIFLTEDDSNIFASIVVVGFIWILSSVNGYSITADPLLWIKWAGIYFAAGTVWSFLKWFSYLYGIKEELRKYKNKYVAKNGIQLKSNGTFDDADFPGFAKYLNENYYLNGTTIRTKEDTTPGVGTLIGDLTRWVVWWPFSAFWTILNDPIRRIAQFIVRRFRGAYEALANRVFRNEV